MSVSQSEREVKRQAEATEEFEVRDQRKASWFWLDNELIDQMGAVIGPIAGAIYTALARYAGNDSQSCYPSIKTLCEKWGLSRSSVKRAIKTLEDERMIKVERHPDAARKHLANTYTLLPPDNWKKSQNAETDEVPDRARSSQNPGLGPHRTEPRSSENPQPDLYNQTHNNQPQHHDAADAANDDDSLRDDETTERQRLIEMLTDLGDDRPETAIERALEHGWSLASLAEDVKRLASLDGSVRNKVGLLRSMIPKGPAALNAALGRYGARQSCDRDGHDEAKHLQFQLEGLLAEWHSGGTEEERRAEIQRKGQEIKARLRELGEDPDKVIATWRAKWIETDESEYTGSETISAVLNKFDGVRV